MINSDVFATTTDRYQYSGQEFDRMNGLDLYDFHARQYDPVLGRFTTPDPLSEKYYHISPYAYCLNNPIKLIDPVKITKETLNILFKGALDKHLNPLRIIYRYMFNNPQTIEYRNEQNREKKR